MKYFFQNYNATKVPFKKLKESVGRTFDKHVSLKKHVKGNQSLFANKYLCKEIMKR